MSYPPGTSDSYILRDGVPQSPFTSGWNAPAFSQGADTNLVLAQSARPSHFAREGGGGDTVVAKH